MQNSGEEMTEDEIVATYLNYIAANFPRMSIERIAHNLDLLPAQVESLLDDMTWDKFKIGSNVKKARAEDARPACVILPFMRLTNND